MNKKKKLILLCTILTVVLISFFACSSTSDSNSQNDLNPSHNHADSTIPESDNGIVFNVHYLRGTYFSDPGNSSSGNITIISSTGELGQFPGSTVMRTNGGYSSQNDQYDDNFFANNFLVIVRHIENSGSIRHVVDTIDEDGNIYITRLVPEIGTADMAAWNIVIELDNNFKSEQYRTVIFTAER